MGVRMKKIALIFVVTQLIACMPEVGSEKWCQNLEAKEKGDWTMNEAKDFCQTLYFQVDVMRLSCKARLGLIISIANLNCLLIE